MKMIQTKRDNDRDKDLGRKNTYRWKAHKKYVPKIDNTISTIDNEIEEKKDRLSMV